MAVLSGSHIYTCSWSRISHVDVSKALKLSVSPTEVRDAATMPSPSVLSAPKGCARCLPLSPSVPVSSRHPLPPLLSRSLTDTCASIPAPPCQCVGGALTSLSPPRLGAPDAAFHPLALARAVGPPGARPSHVHRECTSPLPRARWLSASLLKRHVPKRGLRPPQLGSSHELCVLGAELSSRHSLRVLTAWARRSPGCPSG